MFGGRQRQEIYRLNHSVSLWLRTALVVVAALLLACQPPPPEKSNPASPTRFNSPTLKIHMLDVEQGDSLLIITPERKSVLIDAGTAGSGERVLAALKRQGVNSLDLVIATHPHADHIGGLNKVLAAVPARMFLDSGQAHPTATYEKLLLTVKEKIGELTVARAGQEFELDNGIKLEVLGPQEPLLDNVRGSDENANSVVLRLTFKDFRMLFTGDSEEETEERLLASQADLRADVLKVAHHGSQYATSKEFLARVRPKAALISCGADNDYGHPAAATLARLRKAGVELHRTDMEGEITVLTDGATFKIESEHQPAGDVWQGRVSEEKPRRSKKASK